MSVQDILLSVGAVILCLSLIPTLRGTSYPPKATSVTVWLVLAVFAVVYGTLGLWIACVTTGVQSLMWFVIASLKAAQEANSGQNGTYHH